MRVRFRFYRGTPVMILLGCLILLFAWVLARDEGLPSARWFIAGGSAAGVLFAAVERWWQIRKGWLPKRDKAAERAYARLVLPWALLLYGISVFFDLDWVPVVMISFGGGWFLALSLKPDLPERAVRGWWGSVRPNSPWNVRGEWVVRWPEVAAWRWGFASRRIRGPCLVIRCGSRLWSRPAPSCCSG